MEHLAWELLENKKDIVAAEQVFAALANRARLRSSATSISTKDFEMIQAHKMVSTIISLFFATNNNTNSKSSSPSSSTLTPDQSRALASAVLEKRIPSFVLFGCPETEEQITHAHRMIQLFVHPDKGHVKTTEAFVKLAERKEECLGQMQEFIEFKKAEMMKREILKQQQELNTSAERAFSDSIRQHDIVMSLDSPTNKKKKMKQVPFSSIPTGQNMFSLHHTNNNNHANSLSSPTGGGGQSSSFFEVDRGNTDDESNTALFSSSGSYALPPLQSSRTSSKHRVGAGNRHHHSPMHSSSSSPTKTSSSFASPTRKPDPLERGSVRPPSANAARNASLYAKMNSSPINGSSSSKPRGAFSALYEKNKQKSKEKEFESLMSRLRGQKEQTGSSMNGRFTSFLDQMSKDHCAQKEEEEIESRVKVGNFNNHYHNNSSQQEDYFYDGDEDGNMNNNSDATANTTTSDSMVELTMKALLSKLQNQNSNVKLHCSVTTNNTSSSSFGSSADENGNNNNNNTSPSSKIIASPPSTPNKASSSLSSATNRPKNCRDFVVNRLGEVLQGHLSSIGDDILDRPEDMIVNDKTMVDDDYDEYNNTNTGQQDEGKVKSTFHLEQNKARRKSEVSSHQFPQAIPSPPSHHHHHHQKQQNVHNDGRRRSSSISMNHQGVAVSAGVAVGGRGRNIASKKNKGLRF